MTGKNPWEQQGRERKIARYVAAFNLTVTGSSVKDPSPEQAAEVLRQLDAATEASWKKLQEDLDEPRIASPTTRVGIRAHFATIANSPHEVNHDANDPGLERYAIEGDVAGRKYRVTARNNDGRGFTWSVYVEGEFLRSGYTHGADVLKTFADARAEVERSMQAAAVSL